MTGAADQFALKVTCESQADLLEITPGPGTRGWACVRVSVAATAPIDLDSRIASLSGPVLSTSEAVRKRTFRSPFLLIGLLTHFPELSDICRRYRQLTPDRATVDKVALRSASLPVPVNIAQDRQTSTNQTESVTSVTGEVTELANAQCE
ncbi:hypothetical protein J6590_007643 [Homalodisca vitripennis]|nr:hypothetical protein J6590_007643 [Homalodisca vitripennis]